MANKNLIEVNNLKKYFIQSNFLGTRKTVVKAVDNISFFIKKGETFGLVGESGCGKTTLGRSIIRMHEVDSGEILFDGVDLAKLKKNELAKYQSKMQIVFQDPYSALNPSLNVKEIVGEPLSVHKLSDRQITERVEELLNMVGLTPGDLNKFPFEFSGGQRQRIGIARALSYQPDFILCDEPISALDVSIQAQVINLLEDFQEELGLTYLFVAHDLSMVRHISDRIGVMYLGKIIEIGKSDDVYFNPLHPYTKALISSVPIPDPDSSRKAKRTIIEGELPSPIDIPSGCRFHTRCKYAMDICRIEEPEMLEVSEGHCLACHLYK